MTGLKIEGCCRVNTGFAYTLVNFSCEQEQDLLQQQLGLTDVNEKCLLALSDTSKNTRSGPEGGRSTFARQQLQRRIEMVQRATHQLGLLHSIFVS